MSTNRFQFRSLAVIGLSLATTLGLFAAPGQAQSRTLILLQENSGRSQLTDWMPADVRAFAQAVVDRLVETGESTKFALLAQGSYQRFVDLSDGLCTRANLLQSLIDEAVNSRVVDLCVLGHGSPNRLAMNNGGDLTGRTLNSRGFLDPGTIRSMLTEARAQRGTSFQFTLRAVYMCNCQGSTVNDDWLGIGAKVSVGSRGNNYMPEPMLSDFWSQFVKDDKRAADAAARSYASSVPMWSLVPGYTAVDPVSNMTKIQESEPVVAGDGNLIFHSECQLAVGQSRTFSVAASRIYNLPSLYVVQGQVYRYTATGIWRNGTLFFSPPATDANGYAPGLTDVLRRHPSNMMCLVGERTAKFRDILSAVGGSQFRIGASNTLTAAGNGFLALYANDVMTGYFDNVGIVSVTVERLL